MMKKFDFSNHKTKAVLIGGSAGSFPIVSSILAEIPKDYKYPIIIVMHRLKHVRNGVVEALELKSNIPVKEPLDKEKLKPGVAYVAPANYHMLVELGYTIGLSTDEMVHYSRPSIDLTFYTTGYAYNKNLIAVILTGANRDGADGMRYCKDKGAYTIIQNPNSCVVDTMPKSVLELTDVDAILEVGEIISFLKKL